MNKSRSCETSKKKNISLRCIDSNDGISAWDISHGDTKKPTKLHALSTGDCTNLLFLHGITKKRPISAFWKNWSFPSVTIGIDAGEKWRCGGVQRGRRLTPRAGATAATRYAEAKHSIEGVGVTSGAACHTEGCYGHYSAWGRSGILVAIFLNQKTKLFGKIFDFFIRQPSHMNPRNVSFGSDVWIFEDLKWLAGWLSGVFRFNLDKKSRHLVSIRIFTKMFTDCTKFAQTTHSTHIFSGSGQTRLLSGLCNWCHLFRTFARLPSGHNWRLTWPFIDTANLIRWGGGGPSFGICPRIWLSPYLSIKNTKFTAHFGRGTKSSSEIILNIFTIALFLHIASVFFSPRIRASLSRNKLIQFYSHQNIIYNVYIMNKKLQIKNSSYWWLHTHAEPFAHKRAAFRSMQPKFVVTAGNAAVAFIQNPSIVISWGGAEK